MPATDCQRGTLLGFATGDAFGAAVEFKIPGTFGRMTGYCGRGAHGLALGEWADDELGLLWDCHTLNRPRLRFM